MRIILDVIENLAGKGLAALLRHGDRNSMRFSVESRPPFLANEIAEFLLDFPEQYILSTEGETKSVLRAAVRVIGILKRRDKIGFESLSEVFSNPTEKCWKCCWRTWKPSHLWTQANAVWRWRRCFLGESHFHSCRGGI